MDLCERQDARILLREGVTSPEPIIKVVRKFCLLSPCLFNEYSETMVGEARKHRMGTKIHENDMLHQVCR